MRYRIHVVCGLLSLVALARAASVPNPKVTGPIPANAVPGDPSHDYPFFSTTVDLVTHGYVEEEFFFEGTANRYNTPALATGSIIDSGHPYRTRMVVRRPASPANFNGTVLMEWQQTSRNIDSDALWLSPFHDHLIRRGYAWIGVSAQQAGIHAPATGLKAWSPSRYATLDVTQGGTILDDALSYDIFSQAAQAVRNPTGIDPMGGLPVKRVFAGADGSSANRLVMYHNSIYPLAGVFDAFLLFLSGGQLRTDLKVKVFKLLSETQIAGTTSDQVPLRQPDSDHFRRWEVAGTAAFGFHVAQQLAPLWARDLGPLPQGGCDLPPFSRIPMYMAEAAAFDHLLRWVTDNIAPPGGLDIQVQALGPPNIIARDNLRNALGGIRLPQFAVPTATNTGVNSGPEACRPYGTFQPFDDATLRTLYPGHMTYVTQVIEATLDNLKAGFIVPEDAAAIIADAAQSSIAGVATPTINTGGVVNATSYAGGPLASNMIVSIFGTNLATVTALGQQTAGSYPTSLFGTKVTFGVFDAPLLYVSPSQINALVPAGLAPGVFNVTVSVYDEGSRAEPVTIKAAGSQLPGN